MKKKIVAGVLLCGCLLSLSACNSKQSETKGKETKTEQKETVKDSVDFLVGQWQMEKEGKTTNDTMEFGALQNGKGKFSLNINEETGDYTPGEFLDKEGYRHVEIEAPNGQSFKFKYKFVTKNKVIFVQESIKQAEKAPNINLLRK